VILFINTDVNTDVTGAGSGVSAEFPGLGYADYREARELRAV
jgi:hypothetical protein